MIRKEYAVLKFLAYTFRKSRKPYLFHSPKYNIFIFRSFYVGLTYLHILIVCETITQRTNESPSKLINTYILNQVIYILLEISSVMWWYKFFLSHFRTFHYCGTNLVIGPTGQPTSYKRWVFFDKEKTIIITGCMSNTAKYTNMFY